MIDLLVAETVVKNPAFLGTTIMILVACLVNLFIGRPKTLPLPLAEPGNDGDFVDAISKARKEFPNTPFILQTSPPQVIVPTSLVNDWKSLPETQLAFHKRVYKDIHGRYTNIGVQGRYDQVIEAVKVDLTRNIAKTLSDLQDEVVYAVDTEIGSCKDWTSVTIQAKLLRIVALVSGRVFVGLPLCRNEEWMTSTINYTVDVSNCLRVMDSYHYLIRPFVAPFLPELQKLGQYRRRAGKMLAPTIASVMEAVVQNKAKNSHFESPFRDDQFNMLSWILGHHQKPESLKPEILGEDQMMVAFAALHTTTITASQAVFDLATHPECIDELRTEIMEVTATEPDGKLKKTSMPKLRKLDSFIKESQRMHPLGFLSMLRVVTDPKGLALRTGHHLPKNTLVSVAHPFLGTTPDPSVTTAVSTADQPPLNEFHPFRYSNLRSIPGEENHHQFVTTGADSISFGHGQLACPGRFFASNEIKVVMIEMLKRYDFALGPGGKGVKDGLERPKTFLYGTSFIPDPAAEIFLRDRAE